jgi:hypothetical protein
MGAAAKFKAAVEATDEWQEAKRLADKFKLVNTPLEILVREGGIVYTTRLLERGPKIKAAPCATWRIVGSPGPHNAVHQYAGTVDLPGGDFAENHVRGFAMQARDTLYIVLEQAGMVGT